MILLRIVVECPCESVQDAVQAAVDMDSSGSTPLEIVYDGRTVVDGRDLRRRMAQAGSSV